MGSDLIALPDGGKIELPVAQHEGAATLWKRASRLPAWLPSGVHPQQFMMAVTAEANKKALAECTPASIVASAFNCAVLGLVPGAALGHAHFVPFKKGKRTALCQLIVGFKGFLDLAYGCDFLQSVHCEVVLEGEQFRQWNNAGGAQLEHELPLDRDLSWGNVRGAYCIWQSQNGGHGIETVGLGELRKLKARGNVWDSDPIPMAKKTPLRRAAKTWKLTQRMGLAVTLDGLAEAGEPQPMPVGAQEKGEPPPALDDYSAVDRAQLLGEYQERLADADAIAGPGGIEDIRKHAKENKALDADGLGTVLGWCDQQAEAISNSNQ